VPFLVSWPDHLPQDVRRDELVCLTDLFGIATHGAGATQTRDGIDVLGVVDGAVTPREHMFGYYGEPGTDRFKIMARNKDWKYIYLSNGRREQLFNLNKDPEELVNQADSESQITAKLRRVAIDACRHPGAEDALDGADFKSFEYTRWNTKRIYQFDSSRGVKGFPDNPEDVLNDRSTK
jgi:choline-sulfatase